MLIIKILLFGFILTLVAEAFVRPVHIYLTADVLEATIQDCRIFHIEGLDGGSTTFSIVTDFDNKEYLFHSCSTWRCVGGSGKEPSPFIKALGAKYPTCGDKVSVMKSRVSGEHLIFEGPPSLMRAWFASTSGPLTIAAGLSLITFINLLFLNLREAIIRVRGIVSRDYRDRLALNGGVKSVLLVSNTLAGVTVLIGITLIIFAITFGLGRALLYSDLSSKVIEISLSTLVVFVVLAANAPVHLALFIFSSYKHPVVAAARDIASGLAFLIVLGIFVRSMLDGKSDDLTSVVNLIIAFLQKIFGL